MWSETYRISPTEMLPGVQSLVVSGRSRCFGQLLDPFHNQEIFLAKDHPTIRARPRVIAHQSGCTWRTKVNLMSKFVVEFDALLSYRSLFTILRPRLGSIYDVSVPSIPQKAFHPNRRRAIEGRISWILDNPCRDMTWADFNFHGDVPDAEMERKTAQRLRSLIGKVYPIIGISGTWVKNWVSRGLGNHCGFDVFMTIGRNERTTSGFSVTPRGKGQCPARLRALFSEMVPRGSVASRTVRAHAQTVEAIHLETHASPRFPADGIAK
jgi:hypothetical protein